MGRCNCGYPRCQSVDLCFNPWTKQPDQSSVCTGSDSWHLQWPWFDQVYDVARVAPLVVLPAHTSTELEICMMPDFGVKGAGGGVGLEVGGRQCLVR